MGVGIWNDIIPFCFRIGDGSESYPENGVFTYNVPNYWQLGYWSMRTFRQPIAGSTT